MRRALPILGQMKTEVYMGLREHPREGYVRECASPPTSAASAPSAASPQARRLVIMDLNNTLLCRKSRNARGSMAPVLRPFVRALLRYCLGSETDPASGTAWAGQRSHGPYEVGIWSSAMEANVARMLNGNLLPDGDPLRDRLVGVWGRSTLVPRRLQYDNVQVTKDLEVIWSVLNLQREARLDATCRTEQDMSFRSHPEGSVDPSAADHDASMAAGPWGAHNTILLDDTLIKAKLQPFNALLPPEFGPEEVAAMRRMHRIPDPIPDVGTVSLYPSSGKEVPDNERAMRDMAWDTVLRMDTTLLQIIGVLDEALQQDHVGHWIFSGNSQGFSRWKTHLLPPLTKASASKSEAGSEARPDPLAKDLSERLSSSTPELGPKDQLYWIVRGVQACVRRDIPLDVHHDVYHD